MWLLKESPELRVQNAWPTADVLQMFILQALLQGVSPVKAVSFLRIIC